MSARPDHAKLRMLAGLTAAAIIVAFLAPAIPQDPAYHRFADQVTRFGVPNFGNVASNLPFLLVGLAGIRELRRGRLVIVRELRAGYLVFFIAVTLIGPGSAWYHLAPDNAKLVWDRLPMAVAFMAFFAIIVAENVSIRLGRKLLWPLVLTGIASVIHWRMSELGGHGDLRLYALVQFLPLLLTPLILLMFPASFTGKGYLWTMLGAYGVAKLAELLDEPIFRALHPLSGHALKHLLAAFGVYCVLLGMRRRSKRVPSR